MNKSTDHIRLNVNSVKLSKRICVRQEDTVFRTIAATFVNEGVPILLTDAVLAEILITHPNNTVTYQGCVISGDEVLYTLRSSDIAVTGEHTTQFRITYEDGEVFTSPEFVIEVYSKSFSDTEIVSQNDYSGVTAAVANAASYATTAQNILTEINTQKAAFDDEFAEAQETVVEINKTEEEFKGLSLAVIADAKKAQDAAGNAETYKSAAATSATNAATSATNAATSAASAAASINEMTTLVNTSKTQINTLTSSSITAIENKAEEAIASIETDLSGAAQAAASALASANSASNSATAAETSKNNASTYATAAQGSKEDAQAAADLAAGYKNQAANQVTLAEAQVALATTQASNAASSAASAASAATTAATTAVTAATAKQTATSTDFNLVTADGGIEVERVVGKSFKSKNLLKPTLASATTSNGVTCTPLGDGTFLVNGTASANATFYLSVPQGITAGVTYKYVGCPSGGSNTTYRGCIRYGGNDLGNGNTITYTDEQIANGIYYFCEVKSGQTVSNLIFKPMLTTDTSATYSDFTPYGIHSSGQYGCVDLGELSWSYDSGNKGFFVQMSTLARSRVALYCDDLNVIPTQFSWGSFSGYPNHSVGTALNGTLYCKYTEFTTPSDLKNALKGKLLAYEYSSTPSQYAEVWEEHGKNLFDGNVYVANKFIASNGTQSASSGTTGNDIYKVELSNISNLAITTSGHSNSPSICFYKADGTYISGVAYANRTTFTVSVPSGSNYALYTVYKPDIDIFQIEQGTTATAYVPYQHKTIIFPLAEPLYKDNVVSDEGLVKKYACINLGDLTWGASVVNDGTYQMRAYTDTIPKPKYASGSAYVPNFICAKYNSISADDTFYSVNGITVGSNGTQIRVYDSSYNASDSGTSFKTAMNGVMLYYELATATTQPLTADQLNALNSWKSFAGKTIITSQDLADAKPSVTLNYGKSDAMAKAIEGVCEAKRVDATEPNNEAITDAWTSSKTYSVGSYVIHEDKLYKCLVQNIGVMPPNATYWSLTSCGQEFTSVNSDLQALTNGYKLKAFKQNINFVNGQYIFNTNLTTAEMCFVQNSGLTTKISVTDINNGYVTLVSSKMSNEAYQPTYTDNIQLLVLYR